MATQGGKGIAQILDSSRDSSEAFRQNGFSQTLTRGATMPRVWNNMTGIVAPRVSKGTERLSF